MILLASLPLDARRRAAPRSTRGPRRGSIKGLILRNEANSLRVMHRRRHAPTLEIRRSRRELPCETKPNLNTMGKMRGAASPISGDLMPDPRERPVVPLQGENYETKPTPYLRNSPGQSVPCRNSSAHLLRAAQAVITRTRSLREDRKVRFVMQSRFQVPLWSAGASSRTPKARSDFATLLEGLCPCPVPGLLYDDQRRFARSSSSSRPHLHNSGGCGRLGTFGCPFQRAFRLRFGVCGGGDSRFSLPRRVAP